jgi:hypothetical protein
MITPLFNIDKPKADTHIECQPFNFDELFNTIYRLEYHIGNLLQERHNHPLKGNFDPYIH